MTSTDPMKECEKYDHVPELYDGAFWHCRVCNVELDFFAPTECTITPKSPSPAGWEERFDKQFPELNASNEGGGYDARIYVKDFIKHLLAHRDAALVEKVEGKRLEFYENEYEKGWDDALDAVISLITNREKV